MSKFNEEYDEIMKLSPSEITQSKINSLIDLADTKEDFSKIEKIHLILCCEKVKTLNVQTKR